MSKQTVKQREKLKRIGVRRRKTPPPPSRPASKPDPVQEAAQERAIGFSDGVRITTDFYEGCIALRRGAREMYAADLGYWESKGDAKWHRFIWVPPKPSLWQRIKGWVRS